jgi:tetratricopeptide (TPR) repeat protein
MPAKEQRPFKFWKELKRRNVPRVLAIYAGTAFVILEAADIIFPRWGLPDWTVNLVLYLLLLGAVITVILSWIYDLSPKGIVKTAPEEEEGDREAGPREKTKRPLVSNIIIAVLILIIGLLMYPKIFRNNDSPLGGKTRSSIAVLPLKIIGGDADLSFFASGLVESLTYMLTKVGNADQSFSVIPPSEIVGEITADEARKKYGVSLVITGSIQMDRTSSRLILNLIDTKKQSLIRSEKLDYSREENLIIQDEVISVMVSMLGMELAPDTREKITLGGSTLYDANELYLIGKGILREGVEVLKDIDDALGLFDRAIEKDTLFALAYAGKGQALNLKYNFTLDPSWIDESLKFTQKAIELNDQDAEVLRAYANTLVEKGELDEALDYYKRSLALDSSGFTIYSDMAYMFELSGDMGKAEQYNIKAVQTDPDSHIAHYYLGTFYYYQARYEEAIAEVKKALELSPGHLTMMNLLGACYDGFDEFDKAIEVYEEILESDSTQGHVLRNLGISYFYMGDYEKSAAYYRKALSFIPADFTIYGALGRTYLAWGKQLLAEESLQEAITFGKQDVTCSDLNFVNWFGLMGMKDSADYYLQKSGVEEDPAYLPDSLDGYTALFLGDMYLILGRKEQAYAYLEQALKYGFGWKEIKYSPLYREVAGDPVFQAMVALAEKSKP